MYIKKSDAAVRAGGGAAAESDEEADGVGGGAAGGGGAGGGLYVYDTRRGHEKPLVDEEVVRSGFIAKCNDLSLNSLSPIKVATIDPSCQTLGEIRFVDP